MYILTMLYVLFTYYNRANEICLEVILPTPFNLIAIHDSL